MVRRAVDREKAMARCRYRQRAFIVNESAGVADPVEWSGVERTTRSSVVLGGELLQVIGNQFTIIGEHIKMIATGQRLNADAVSSRM